MHCPKCKADLVNGLLSDMLLTKHCRECQGEWISGRNYQTWKAEHAELPQQPNILAQNYHLPYAPSALDAKTAICPECRCIMARGKVALKEPFYLEHCLTCGGIWCDRGEWAVLEQLQLDRNIGQIFSGVWQAQVRANHANQLERQAVIDKIGIELAQQVFDFADLLAQHPHGDFAAAYIMRKYTNKL